MKSRFRPGSSFGQPGRKEGADLPESGGVFEPPPLDLPCSAHPAWHAYHALCESKRCYHSLFAQQEEKQKQGLAPDPQARKLLEQRLGEHGEAVFAFRRALTELSTQDPATHAVFLRLLSESSGDAGNLRTAGV